MRIRFQADANLDERIVRGLHRREPSADFRTTHAARLKGLHDEEVLKLCAREGRVLVTQDRKTMAAHFRRFVAVTESAGVILVRRRALLAELIDELHLIWECSGVDDWRNQIVWIPL
jgi:predicted nuclease of predicted toxin-antitoxin system